MRLISYLSTRDANGCTTREVPITIRRSQSDMSLKKSIVTINNIHYYYYSLMKK